MRELKFRALDKNKKRWEILTIQELANCDSSSWADVDMETLGEFTGLKDKNGREIYEGDVLSFPTEDGRDRFLDIIYNAEYGEFCPVLRSTNWQPVLRFILDSGAYVIGNIHENPSLLKPISGGL